MDTTLVDQVRTLMVESDDEIVTTADLCLYLTLSSRSEKAKVYSAMRDLVRMDEVERVSPGKYKYISKKPVNSLSKKMWKLLRARKVVTYDDFIELTGASKEYVQEWCRKLEKRGIVKKSRDEDRNNKGQLKGGMRFGKYKDDKIILIEDPVIMPLLDETSIKMKKIREKKKNDVLKVLNQAQKAITQAEILMGG
ncbi:MAG: hypothetical protein GY714_10605 [Desulfobacterales bacterium]|nr:hypothetical protein [Desulfobacterales bacterium]